MKKLFLILILPVLTVSISFAQKMNFSTGSEYCSLKKSSMQRLPLLRKDITSGPTHKFDVLSYTLSLNLYQCYVSPYPHSYTASNIIKFKVDSTLNSIKLNAVGTSIVINSVGMNGVSFSHANDTVTVQLNRTYNPGEIAEVKVNYSHLDVPDNGFYVENGMVFTDAEPEGARFWFPCWDHPYDKALVELTAKVKNGVLLGANGALMDSTLNGDTLTYHWKSIHNVATYLTVISSKVGYGLHQILWRKLSDTTQFIPLRFYFNAGENPSPVESTMKDMITYYSQQYCEHPFQKNGFAAMNEQFSWGGMENQTLTSICPGCWEISLAAHEFAHQWFGDMITCATWSDIWLNEGFATWSEAHYREHLGGYASYKSDIDGYANTYLSQNPGWAISEPDWAVNTPNSAVLFNYAVTYCKGASVLHMLRYTLGDSLYFATLQAYAADTNLRFKYATIPDFNAKVNAVTGQNYDWYFNQWIYQPNHPVYSNTYNFNDLGNGQWKVNFVTTQVQTNPVFFKMPVEIRIVFYDNTDTIVSVMNDINYQYFSWVFDKHPAILFFDYHNNIVLKSASTTVGIIEQQASGKIHLGQNYPNPATGHTTISWEQGFPMNVTLLVTDMTGRTILTPVSGAMDAGTHSAEIDCSVLQPGVYYYNLKTTEGSLTKKMIITR
jgi:aminopeptidase N